MTLQHGVLVAVCSCVDPPQCRSLLRQVDGDESTPIKMPRVSLTTAVPLLTSNGSVGSLNLVLGMPRLVWF